jgi:hypothetical protein
MAQPRKILSPEFLAARHRKQVGYQIWLPLIIGILIALSLAALAIVGTVQGSSEVNRLGNISAVFLLIPNLIANLITLTILIVSIFIVRMLYRKMRGWLARIMGILEIIRTYTRTIADKIVAPLISVKSAGAVPGAVKNKLRKKVTS